jgi:hypothetical protein
MFDSEYATEAACLASPEVKNIVGKPSNVTAGCYFSKPI